jgi:uncharacterized membrane protein AbrB (regulator of aidB expression)
MQSDWASENLQTIRTLMERSAVYRRALAPVMGALGLTGIVAAVVGCYLRFQTPGVFVVYWMATSVVCLVEAFLLVRRQALKEAETFWSPPTRRVARALSPSFFGGFAAGLPYIILDGGRLPQPWLLVPLWMILYGCALHAAGFFMPRGFRWFGWAFVLSGCSLGFWGLVDAPQPSLAEANAAMGALFGGSHWAYGVYLYFTERRRDAP